MLLPWIAILRVHVCLFVLRRPSRASGRTVRDRVAHLLSQPARPPDETQFIKVYCQCESSVEHLKMGRHCLSGKMKFTILVPVQLLIHIVMSNAFAVLRFCYAAVLLYDYVESSWTARHPISESGLRAASSSPAFVAVPPVRAVTNAGEKGSPSVFPAFMHGRTPASRPVSCGVSQLLNCANPISWRLLRACTPLPLIVAKDQSSALPCAVSYCREPLSPCTVPAPHF